MITPVSDDLLALMVESCHFYDHNKEAGEAIAAEVRALRVVADTAKALLVDWAEEDDNGIQTRLDVIEMALRDAGRLP